MKKIILYTLALLVATGLSAQSNDGKWQPVGNRKIRVVHWGIIHNHSKGKWEAVKSLSDDYELLGWVDDTDSKAMRMKEPNKKRYASYPCFTPEQVFNEIKPDLIVIETANDDLVGVATQIAKHGIACKKLIVPSIGSIIQVYSQPFFGVISARSSVINP